MLHLPDPRQRVTIKQYGGNISWLTLGEDDTFCLRLLGINISAEFQTLHLGKLLTDRHRGLQPRPTS